MNLLCGILLVVFFTLYGSALASTFDSSGSILSSSNSSESNEEATLDQFSTANVFEAQGEETNSNPASEIDEEESDFTYLDHLTKIVILALAAARLREQLRPTHVLGLSPSSSCSEWNSDEEQQQSFALTRSVPDLLYYSNIFPQWNNFPSIRTFEYDFHRQPIYSPLERFAPYRFSIRGVFDNESHPTLPLACTLLPFRHLVSLSTIPRHLYPKRQVSLSNGEEASSGSPRQANAGNGRISSAYCIVSDQNEPVKTEMPESLAADFEELFRPEELP